MANIRQTSDRAECDFDSKVPCSRPFSVSNDLDLSWALTLRTMLAIACGNDMQKLPAEAMTKFETVRERGSA